MDFHNNDKGREIGLTAKNEEEIISFVLKAIKNGDLIYKKVPTPIRKPL